MSNNACSSSSSSRQFDYCGEDDLRNFLLKFEREEEEELKISKAMDFSGGGCFHEMYSNMLSAATDAAPPSLLQNQNQELFHPPSSSLVGLSNKYKIKHAVSGANRASSSLVMSTKEVIEIAAGQFVQVSDPRDEQLLMLDHPLSSMLPRLPPDAVKSIDLVLLLLFSADKTDQQQLELAVALLEQCRDQSSNVGNPVERLVHYFSEALQERIERKMQFGSWKQLPIAKAGSLSEDTTEEEVMLSQHPGLLALRDILPFTEVLQFTAIQAIAERVATATRVHLIDLGIMAGMRWTILMQVFATRSRHPIKLLKISAVGPSKDKVDEIGKHLKDFAKKLNLRFAFNAVIVSDRKDLEEQSFGLKAGEVVAIHAPFILRMMILRPASLEKVMRLLRGLKPCVMIVSEIQASLNSTSFIKRFTEALFFYGAWFDCVGICLEEYDLWRMAVESQLFRRGIRSMIAAEDSDRLIRHVQIDVWRSFFARFGFVEIDLGRPALYQAQLINDQFACASCCTNAMDGKGLTIGWKGTPLHFVSAWRLQR
ncbi:hypothetical protein ACLOJK_017632 [Asimina triloba]